MTSTGISETQIAFAEKQIDGATMDSDKSTESGSRPHSSAASEDESADDKRSEPTLRQRKSSPAEDAASNEGQKSWPRMKSLMAILCLWSFTPFLLVLAGYAWLKHRLLNNAFEKGETSNKKKLKILVTGGRMSKASAVARAVGRDGHKVLTAETMPYRLCHARFSAYASRHYVLPRPTRQPAEWQARILEIVKEQNIDLIIPCTAAVESSAYAHLREVLPANVRVFALDGETCDMLDHKYTFNQVLAKSNIPCPETANMECYADAAEFFLKKEKALDGKKYIVKPAVYDPKARTEIMFLPIEDKRKQREYLKSRNATPQVPYVIQEVLNAPEYGSYAIYNQGHLTGFEFFESAASCLVYKQCGEQYDQVLALHKDLGKSMHLTGQLTLDLMHKDCGKLVPIECNPRIHSAVCTLEGHRNMGAMLTDPEHKPSDAEIVTSHKDTFKYWLMDQVFLMLGFWKAEHCFQLKMSEMFKGQDALLHGDDPMPFLAMYLVQIPSVLILEIINGTEWLKIDFCVGKIVKKGGD